MKSLSRSHEQLERSKRQLEEEVASLRRQVEVGVMDQSQAEQYRRETEERARQEIRHKLEEVNLFLQVYNMSQRLNIQHNALTLTMCLLLLRVCMQVNDHYAPNISEKAIEYKIITARFQSHYAKIIFLYFFNLLFYILSIKYYFKKLLEKCWLIFMYFSLFTCRQHLILFTVILLFIKNL